ncbi:beta-lactamase [Chthoniobacter flavus Ellin428]|uniref:Beta-lactamase n=1 Tax=Chthoniobacter flavus Ellin428 TaxID=497964 RepID=B4D042_9BACT|nr:serine hydrolase domain-containing protein [Chthoniobacter flavus]EDY20356.1 beta-lactamase [Chthoniobacter flavus Ellin428]TCO94249.1 CubicO group peptidase (beta-lactamase class C family) [Chthoniobacter flavus]
MFALGILVNVARAAEDLAPEDFTTKLEEIRRERGLPALAAAAMRHGKLVINAATGVRKLGSDELVTTDDKWHLGSCTKSMTAMLAGMMVDEGKLSWHTTIGEVFPDLNGAMRPSWRNVTLDQLLTHRSGAPGNPPVELWAEALEQKGTPTEQRLAILRGIVCNPPEAPHGKKFIYSNEGYAIAGAMIERVTGEAWEDLMRERIFEPLGMTSAGFGAPATPGKIDQPWGHLGEVGELRPVPPGPMADNPPAIAPAATVHASLADFARYADWHADWKRAEPRLLTEETFNHLHQSPPNQGYACGWLVDDRDWAGGNVFWHTGSNAMFYAVMWVAPEREATFVAATNAAHAEADDACNAAVVALIRRVLGKY